MVCLSSFSSKPCIIKLLLDSVFVVYTKINNQGLGKCYQPRPSAWLITLTQCTSTLIILDITKTSSNNCLLFMHFQENMTYE